MKVIPNGYAHAPLLRTVSANGGTRSESDLREFRLIISVQKIWGGIVGDVCVEFSAIPEIRPDHLHAVISTRVVDAYPLRYIGECPVAVIAKQAVARPLKTARPALYVNAPKFACRQAAEPRK